MIGTAALIRGVADFVSSFMSVVSVMWFEALTGFAEQSPEQVRDNLNVQNGVLTSQVNGRQFQCGRLETPTLAELRSQVKAESTPAGKLAINEVVADVQVLHADPANAGALFQVASQFNLLEMVSPSITPEAGVGIYENDFTQGPACAIAAGAGTIFRNYFAPVDGDIGQTAARQIDCLADLGAALGNTDGRLWRMQSGYALASKSGLQEIANRLAGANEEQRDALREQLRIGLQSNTQVTINECEHLVSQAYGSALPVAYSSHSSQLWEPFARLILEASYEATFCAAALNSQKTGNNKLFLTLLGGGAFGNETDWILSAIRRSMAIYAETDLDVFIVSFRSANLRLRELTD